MHVRVGDKDTCNWKACNARTSTTFSSFVDEDAGSELSFQCLLSLTLRDSYAHKLQQLVAPCSKCATESPEMLMAKENAGPGCGQTPDLPIVRANAEAKPTLGRNTPLQSHVKMQNMQSPINMKLNKGNATNVLQKRRRMMARTTNAMVTITTTVKTVVMLKRGMAGMALWPRDRRMEDAMMTMDDGWAVFPLGLGMLSQPPA